MLHQNVDTLQVVGNERIHEGCVMNVQEDSISGIMGQRGTLSGQAFPTVVDEDEIQRSNNIALQNITSSWIAPKIAKKANWSGKTLRSSENRTRNGRIPKQRILRRRSNYVEQLSSNYMHY